MTKLCTHCGSPVVTGYKSGVLFHASGYRYCTVNGSIPGTVATVGPVTP